MKSTIIVASVLFLACIVVWVMYETTHPKQVYCHEGEVAEIGVCDRYAICSVRLTDGTRLLRDRPMLGDYAYHSCSEQPSPELVEMEQVKTFWSIEALLALFAGVFIFLFIFLFVRVLML